MQRVKLGEGKGSAAPRLGTAPRVAEPAYFPTEGSVNSGIAPPAIAQR